MTIQDQFSSQSFRYSFRTQQQQKNLIFHFGVLRIYFLMFEFAKTIPLFAHFVWTQSFQFNGFQWDLKILFKSSKLICDSTFLYWKWLEGNIPCFEGRRRQGVGRNPRRFRNSAFFHSGAMTSDREYSFTDWLRALPDSIDSNIKTF